MAKNYNTQNLIQVPPANVQAGTLAIKIGDTVFTAGNTQLGATQQQEAAVDQALTALTAILGE